MVKVFGCVLLVAAFGGMGWLCASKDRKRRDFYGQWYQWNERFASDLSLRLPLTAFLDKYPYKGEFAAFLEAYRASFTTNTLELHLPFLGEAEESAVPEYFLALGKSDVASQMRLVDAYRPMLRERKELSAKDYATKSLLYGKLGVLLGLLIVVLIV